jgi:uncharacterized protein YodC (DUF2158 family)
MSGPYNLKYIHLFVTEASPGAFILSRNGRMADRVGRADGSLAEELQRAANEGKYRYFWFEYTGNASEAFGLECAWYHRYHPTDNAEHPAAALSGEKPCSVKGCSVGSLAHARG